MQGHCNYMKCLQNHVGVQMLKLANIEVSYTIVSSRSNQTAEFLTSNIFRAYGKTREKTRIYKGESNTRTGV